MRTVTFTLANLWPWILLVAVIGLTFAAMAMNRWWMERGRRHPFSADINRFPGQSLGRRVDDIYTDILSYLVVLFMLPMIFYWTHQISFQGANPTWSVLINMVGFAAFLAYLLVKLIRCIRQLRHCRLGMWGEMATGQMLDMLMLDGHRVFHDLPADKFNIDHVVVTNSCVLAVETKARSKPDKARGKIDYSVEFDGQVLKFPDWTDARTIRQATRQADWLASWLRSATGDRVPVAAVVAIPGWYINRTGSSRVYVINPKQIGQLIKGLGGEQLRPDLRRRTIHQLEQRCKHAPWHERELREPA
jgi:hypothetical protein